LKGLRKLVKSDISAVSKLLNQHLTDNYKVHMVFTDEEVAHWVLPRENVIYSYVVEDDGG
jgi:glycylpeptide N-tetradecanoyltransferase